MKDTYPIIITRTASRYIAYIPDFDIATEGDDLASSVEMARDAVGLMGIDLEDDHEPIPPGTDIEKIKAGHDEMVLQVDIDFSEYRKQNDSFNSAQ